jgi:hypothetical protein
MRMSDDLEALGERAILFEIDTLTKGIGHDFCGISDGVAVRLDL